MLQDFSFVAKTIWQRKNCIYDHSCYGGLTGCTIAKSLAENIFDFFISTYEIASDFSDTNQIVLKISKIF